MQPSEVCLGLQRGKKRIVFKKDKFFSGLFLCGNPYRGFKMGSRDVNEKNFILSFFIDILGKNTLRSSNFDEIDGCFLKKVTSVQ